MCEHLSRVPAVQIADKDITVYKHVYKVPKKYKWFPFIKKVIIYSSIRKFQYKLGKTYTTVLGKWHKAHLSPYNLYSSTTGFYSYSESVRFDWNANVKCIIPKGSKYYDCGSVLISESIKLVKLL